MDLDQDPFVIAGRVALALKIAALIVVFDPWAFDTFSLPKSAASHGLSYILAAILVCLWVRHGTVVTPSSRLSFVVAAIVAIASLATVFAVDLGFALYGADRRYLGLTHIVDGALLYVATITLLRSARAYIFMVLALAAATAVVLTYAGIQRAGLDPVTYANAPTQDNPISTLGQPDILGGYLGIVSVAGLGGAIVLRNIVPRRWRYALIAVSISCLLVVSSASVRNSLLAIGGGLVAVSALELPRWRTRMRPIGLGVAAAVALVAIVILATPLGARLSPQNLESALSGRQEIWAVAVRVVAEHPLLGVGPDNFAAVYPAERLHPTELLGNQLQNSTHNWILQEATNAGIAGLAAWLVFLGATIALCLALSHRGDPACVVLIPLAAFLAQGLVNVSDLALDWIPWVCAGLCVAAIHGPPAALRARPLSLFARAASVGVLGLALIGVVLTIPRVSASQAMFLSEGYVAANRGGEGVPLMTGAVADDARRAVYWSGLGTALSGAGKPVAAAAAYLEAARLQPWQPLYWENLGLMYLASGNQQGAVAALERATRADPFTVTAPDVLARIYFSRGDYEPAAREGERAARLLPNRAPLYELPVNAYLKLGRPEDAERLVRFGLTQVDVTQLRLLLARVLIAEGRRAEALAELDHVLATEPTNGDALNLKASITSP